MVDQQTPKDMPPMSTSPSEQEPIAGTTSSPDTSSPSTSASSSSSAPAPAPVQGRNCSHCNANETEAKPLKPCSKCQTALYCGRECQKAGYKVHKKTCAKEAQAYALKADLKPSAPPKVPKEGHRGGLQKWQFDT